MCLEKWKKGGRSIRRGDCLSKGLEVELAIHLPSSTGLPLGQEALAWAFLIPQAPVLGPLNLGPPGTERGVALTLLMPTRYMFGMTVHRRLSTDTHMSPLAGRLCWRSTRQRYLQGPTLSLGLWNLPQWPTRSESPPLSPSPGGLGPSSGSTQCLLIRKSHSIHNTTSWSQTIVKMVSVE